MTGWRVAKRSGVWFVYQEGAAMDSFDTLPEAHSYALACVVSNECFEPGGLTRLWKLIDDADWWRSYLASIPEIEERPVL